MTNSSAKSILLGLTLWSVSTFAGAADRPLALVESIEGAARADIAAFQYVYDGDKIDLRENGVLTLAFFDSCEVSVFTGGVVKLDDDGASVSKGGSVQSFMRPCQTSALALREEASEAGAAVRRVTPFGGEDWREISVAASRPIFIWPEAGEGDYQVSVYYLDADPVRLVWQGPFENGLAYPQDAPALENGMPYRVVIERNGKEKVSAVFSVDRGLELPESPLTSAIPLGL